MELLKKGLSTNQLKVIAIIAMTIDHIAYIFLFNRVNDYIYLTLRVLGKITIPIMWFFISEGYYHTKNIKKYIGRLFIFSIISHFAYCYVFNKTIIPSTIFFETSVIWSLMWGLIALVLVKNEKIIFPIKVLLFFIITCLVYNADWGLISIVAIVILGLTREDRKKQMLMMSIAVTLYEITIIMQNKNYYQLMHFGIFLSIPLILMYNGQKGKYNWIKWFFYIYYPLHLLILGLINNKIM